MEKLKRYLQFIERHGEEVICGSSLVIISTCVFAQVVCRYLFHTAITWTEELAGFAMVWAVYSGAALAVRERFHIRIMIGVMALPRLFSLATVLVGDLIWMAFNIFMIWQGWLYEVLMWEQTYISPSLQIDQKWPQSIIFIGYILISLRVIQIYVQWIRSGCRGIPGLGRELQAKMEEKMGGGNRTPVAQSEEPGQ